MFSVNHTTGSQERYLHTIAHSCRNTVLHTHLQRHSFLTRTRTIRENVLKWLFHLRRHESIWFKLELRHFWESYSLYMSCSNAYCSVMEATVVVVSIQHGATVHMPWCSSGEYAGHEKVMFEISTIFLWMDRPRPVEENGERDSHFTSSCYVIASDVWPMFMCSQCNFKRYIWSCKSKKPSS